MCAGQPACGPRAGKEACVMRKKRLCAAALCALLALGLAGCGDGEVKDTVSEAVSRAEDAVSETVSRVEEGAKDAASRVESFFEESAGSRVDEELSSAGDRARSR